MQAKNILGFAVGPVVAALLGAVSLPVTAWMFGADDIGRIAMLQTITSLAVILFGLGLDQSYMREYHHTQDRFKLFLFAIAPGLLLLTAVFIALLLMAPSKIAQSVFGSDDVRLTYATALVILAAYCSRYFSLILRMEERGLAYSMSQLMPKLVYLGVLLALYVSDVPRIFAWLLLAHLLGVLVTMIIFSWNTRHTWMNSRNPTGDRSLRISNLTRYGIPLMFAGLAFWGLEAIDKIMLRYLGSFSDLGIYAVATGIAAIASTLSVIFTTIWIPTAYRWAEEPNCAERIESVARKLTAAGSILVCLAGVFSWLLFFILPLEFSDVAFLVCACMIPPVLYAAGEVTGVGLGIARQSRPVLLIAILVCILNVFLNWMLIPHLGSGGAAISTGIAFFLFYVIRTEASMRYWARMRRGRLYSPVFAVTLMSLLFVVIGPLYPYISIAAWLGVGLVLTLLNREVMMELLANLVLSERTARSIV